MSIHLGSDGCRSGRYGSKAFRFVDIYLLPDPKTAIRPNAT